MILIALSSCAHFQKRETPAQIQLTQAITQAIATYEDGDYKKALTEFEEALNLPELNSSDQVQAHKYMAFIYCLTNKPKQGYNQFKTALEIDPNFELTPAEAGHPMWGQAFKKAKAEMEASKNQETFKPQAPTKKK